MAFSDFCPFSCWMICSGCPRLSQVCHSLSVSRAPCARLRVPSLPFGRLTGLFVCLLIVPRGARPSGDERHAPHGKSVIPERCPVESDETIDKRKAVHGTRLTCYDVDVRTPLARPDEHDHEVEHDTRETRRHDCTHSLTPHDDPPVATGHAQTHNRRDLGHNHALIHANAAVHSFAQTRSNVECGRPQRDL